MISHKKIAIKFLFLLLVIFCVFISGDAKVRCIEKERKALLSFKNGLIDDSDSLSSWQSNECCEWYGVTCNDATGHVITLQLYNAGLHGEVRSSLLELHYLNHLDLGFNDFGGVPIPEFIGSMKQLQYLYLVSSNFSGTIPPLLWNLTNLRNLDLSFNSLSRASLLPTSEFKSLEKLNLVGNQLNGSIPDLRVFPSLIELRLSRNNFTGSIPPSIGQLSNLQDLDLSDNHLEGLVSESHFIKLDKLTILYLSNNPSLHIGSIAPDWTPPFQLEYLSLDGCYVGPYFPKWIRTQTKLIHLSMGNANITDKAPEWLWSISSSLRFLYLPDNEISGTIQNLSSTSIETLDLRNNKLSGPIPLFPANVHEILLSGNMLSGSISSICTTRLYRLVTLVISYNQLAGEIPDCWEKMPNLTSFISENNSFSGEIPPSIGALQRLGILQLHGNSLSGELPYNLRLCQYLYLIDVGGNKLTGVIPTWIGQMYRTQFINLRGNKLHGSIPREICNLTNIQVLDLSINNLSSIIPDCFNKLSVLASKNTTIVFPAYIHTIYLTYSAFQWKGQESKYMVNLRLLKLIDLSSNKLSGNIPKSFSNMSELKSLNLSRNSLTGYIIPDIGKMESLDSLDLSYNQFSGKIPTSLARIHTLGVLDLSHNNLSGKIPTGTQFQSFNASTYDANDGLCGDPLPTCSEDRWRSSPTNPRENVNEKSDNNFSFMEEVGISMAFGFIFGFWGVVGSIILNKSWRIAFFNLSDAAGDWFYVKIFVFVSKWRQAEILRGGQARG